jgi:hypothetical protein
MTRFIGAGLMALGGLVALLSGLCSLGVLATPFFDNYSARGEAAMRELMSIVAMVAIFGGVPFAVGLGLFFLGRAVRRGPSA